MTASFQSLETNGRKVQKVAAVGEIYTKYCRLGNRDLMEYLAAESWYMASAQREMMAILNGAGFCTLPPFACLPGHIFGKGQHAALQRKLPQARLVSVDYDASTGEGTVQSRIRMLLDERL